MLRSTFYRALMACFFFVYCNVLQLAYAQDDSATKAQPGGKLSVGAASSWRQLSSNATQTVWQADTGTKFTLTKGDKDCPVPVDDVNSLRSYVRKLAASEKAGLVQADLTKVDGHVAAWFITKGAIPNYGGYRYVARCVIPRESAWHELRMDATAIGPTGMREAMLAGKLNLYGGSKLEDVPATAPPTPLGGAGGKRMKGLFKDPYDSKFDAAGNYWVTDDSKYDKLFPRHPLSRIRATFPETLKSIKVP